MSTLDFGLIAVKHHSVILSLGSIVLLGLVALKAIFGTFSVFQIIADFKLKKKISTKYNELFTAREGLQFHISWAKSRGDNEEARQMIRDLIAVDKVI